ncbi:hypothetical protein TCAL_15202 [Tigriopus californicus]|uniref:Uncharacterized protein n=1 Tax=Tigriopus californicus TaxID=6832 RepID=A0A553NBP9_TIGCA|nr:hypothetical protein TCAL_15202 [Tigriopus californicus]
MTVLPDQISTPNLMPPWKQELLLRKSALSRTIEPNLSFVCKKLEVHREPRSQEVLRKPVNELARLARRSRSLGDGSGAPISANLQPPSKLGHLVDNISPPSTPPPLPKRSPGIRSSSGPSFPGMNNNSHWVDVKHRCSLDESGLHQLDLPPALPPRKEEAVNNNNKQCPKRRLPPSDGEVTRRSTRSDDDLWRPAVVVEGLRQQRPLDNEGGKRPAVAMKVCQDGSGSKASMASTTRKTSNTAHVEVEGEEEIMETPREIEVVEEAQQTAVVVVSSSPTDHHPHPFNLLHHHHHLRQEDQLVRREEEKWDLSPGVRQYKEDRSVEWDSFDWDEDSSKGPDRIAEVAFSSALSRFVKPQVGADKEGQQHHHSNYHHPRPHPGKKLSGPCGTGQIKETSWTESCNQKTVLLPQSDFISDQCKSSRITETKRVFGYDLKCGDDQRKSFTSSSNECSSSPTSTASVVAASHCAGSSAPSSSSSSSSSVIDEAKKRLFAANLLSENNHEIQVKEVFSRSGLRANRNQDQKVVLEAAKLRPIPKQLASGLPRKQNSHLDLEVDNTSPPATSPSARNGEEKLHRRSVTFSCPEVLEEIPIQRYPVSPSESSDDWVVENEFRAVERFLSQSEPQGTTMMDENIAMNEDDLDHSQFDNIGRASLARIYRSNKNANSNKIVAVPPMYATPSSLDSDGTFGSGGESDSSEEIHYGPGFVNRLKTRYLSVALRSTSTRGVATLRRTASLENFLDKDKTDEQVELRKTPANSQQRRVSPHYQRHSAPVEGGSRGMFTKRGPPVTNNRFHANSGRPLKKNDSMKRVQSVEVLNVSEPGSRSSLERKAVDAGGPIPPPLPPKAEKATLETVVNSLANDAVRVYDRKGKPITRESIVRSGESSVNALPRRPLFKRRSSSLLFGVEEKELPAPDTVKETRKIFESRSGGPGGRKPGPFFYGGSRIKSRSTSSLYHSRSRSSDRGLSPSSQDSNIHSPLTRKRSDDNIQHSQYSTRISGSPVRTIDSPRGGSPVRTPQSPVTRNPVGGPRPAGALSNQSKPSLPNKPIHLASSPCPSPTAKPFMSGGHAPTPANEPPKHDQNNSTITGGGSSNGPTSASVTTPTSGIVKQVSESSANKEVYSPGTSNAQLKDQDDKVVEVEVAPMDEEEGIKRISNDSITKIREGGSSVSFNFSKPTGMAMASPTSRTTPPTYLPYDKENNAMKQVGVIRPMTRSLGQADPRGPLINNKLERNKEALIQPSAVPSFQEKEIILIPKDELRAPILPKKSWNSVADKNQRNSSHLLTSNGPPPSVVKPSWIKKSQVEDTDTQKKTPSTGDSLALAKPAAVNEEVIAKSESSGGGKKAQTGPMKADLAEKPSSPAAPLIASQVGRNNNYRDDWKKRNEQKNTIVFNFVHTEKDVTHIDNDGRDISNRRKKNSKKRNQQLTKDSGIILINDPYSGNHGTESTDCDIDSDSDDSEIDVHRPVSPCNFIVLGANVKTEKSSIRSKSRPMKISGLPTVGQELSPQQMCHHPLTRLIVEDAPTPGSLAIPSFFPFKRVSSRVSSEDHLPIDRHRQSPYKSVSPEDDALWWMEELQRGLGNYTPSKIQMNEAPFQLGVSRGKTPTEAASTPNSNNNKPNGSQDKPDGKGGEVLRPTEDAISWSGSSSSSDILF